MQLRQMLCRKPEGNYSGSCGPLPEEWWHFTLENEPYPDTYFDFPVDMPEN